jgi:hypothetical protein
MQDVSDGIAAAVICQGSFHYRHDVAELKCTHTRRSPTRQLPELCLGRILWLIRGLVDKRGAYIESEIFRIAKLFRDWEEDKRVQQGLRRLVWFSHPLQQRQWQVLGNRGENCPV